jgi:hypothetical protein
MKWTADRAVIENVVSRADDEAILQMVKQARKTGGDFLFGRPTGFVDFFDFSSCWSRQHLC